MEWVCYSYVDGKQSADSRICAHRPATAAERFQQQAPADWRRPMDGVRLTNLCNMMFTAAGASI